MPKPTLPINHRIDDQLDLLKSEAQQTKEVQAIDLVLNTLDADVASLKRVSNMFRDTSPSAATMAICASIRAESLAGFRSRVEQIRESLIEHHISNRRKKEGELS